MPKIILFFSSFNSKILISPRKRRRSIPFIFFIAAQMPQESERANTIISFDLSQFALIVENSQKSKGGELSRFLWGSKEQISSYFSYCPSIRTSQLSRPSSLYFPIQWRLKHGRFCAHLYLVLYSVWLFYWPPIPNCWVYAKTLSLHERTCPCSLLFLLNNELTNYDRLQHLDYYTE